MKWAQIFFLSLLLFFMGVANDHAVEPAGFDLETANLRVHISPEGKITGIKLGSETAERPVTAETALAGCQQPGPSKATRLENGGVEFEKQMINIVSEIGGLQATLRERFLPRRDSIRWEWEVRGEGKPWSMPIETRLHWPLPGQSLFWTAWGDPRPQGADWTNPLRPAEWQDREFFYGGRRFKYFKEPSTFSLPLATILDKNQDSGFSLVLSPEDLVLTLRMRTTPQGDVIFSREHHRISQENVVRGALDLVAHPADWRGGVAWLVGRYPEFFDPPNPAVQLLGGCGSYSSHAEITEAERLMRMAYRVNWKASFDFPYMGMFIPPVKSDTEEWTDFMKQKTSIAKMRASARTLRRLGFYLLNYFNVTEFGAFIKFPPPPRKTVREEDLWQDANDFLYGRLSPAILLGPDGKPIRSWEGSVVMDPGEKVYQDFLVEQAKRHLEKIPESAGICIDRIDWIMEYNRRRDDGVTWFEGKPARSLVVSWHALMNRLGPLMHDAGKVIYGNSMYPRIDLYRQLDGFYDEHGEHPHSLNVCSLLALNKPYIAWTWEMDLFDKNTDEYFQRHLHLGAFLTAPVPGNDHTILPDQNCDSFYFDYGPLLDALRGKRWVLLPHVVRVEGDKALANVFEVPGGYVVPVTFGGKEAAVQVLLKNLPKMSRQNGIRIEALHPGRPQPIALHAVEEGNLIRLDVPLKRGCAMLLLNSAWMEPKAAYFHDSARIELGTTLEGAELHYTLNGSEPTPQSPAYSVPLELRQNSVVKAAVFRGGRKISGTLEREYVKIPPAAPAISPPGGFFDDSLEVTLQPPGTAAGESIHYTLDGTTPTRQSPRYSEPLRIHRSASLQAVRFTPGSASPPATAEFSRRGPRPPKPDVALGVLTPRKATVGWGGHPRVNRSIADHPLSLGGKIYEQGMGVHADSELEYDLSSEYTRFVAVIGIDDAMRKYKKGAVIFEVRLDENCVFSSPVMRPGDFTYVDVPIPPGSKKIRLLVSGAGIDIGIDCDHGDWADAGFVVKKTAK